MTECLGQDREVLSDPQSVSAGLGAVAALLEWYDKGGSAIRWSAYASSIGAELSDHSVSLPSLTAPLSKRAPPRVSHSQLHYPITILLHL